MGVKVESLEEADRHIESLTLRQQELERQLRSLVELVDVLASPLWKRLLFRLDGWPAYRLGDRPSWRPWRRWWIS